MKKSRIVALALCLAMLVCLAACGGNTDTSSSASQISVCLASEPQTLDPALNSAVDGACLAANAFTGLASVVQD